MDCILKYNFTCVNLTYSQFNSSSYLSTDVLDPSVRVSGNTSNYDQTSSILVSVQHCILTAVILGTIILLTITGNILVIAAVKLEKSLHSVAYYLFVSLAVADLMVASMVMPVAVLKEVTRSWVLGSFICDAWVMVDLLCCTASILHLVAIALDRYWSITNLDYATKRTPARILILICLIWVSSILISSSHLFPIFRDKRGRSPGQCHLIGNVPYTILSTVGAFYIPLFVMCIIYWKIFQAAKFRIRRRAFGVHHRPSPPQSGIVTSTTPTFSHHQQDIILNYQTEISNHDTSPKKGTKYQSISSSSAYNKHSRGTLRSSNNHHHHHQTDVELGNQSQDSSPESPRKDHYQLKPFKKPSYSLIEQKHDGMITTKTTTTPTIPPIILSSPNVAMQQDYDNGIHQIHSTRTCQFTSSLNYDSSIQVNTIRGPLAISNYSPSNSSQVTDTQSVKSMSTNILSNASILTKSPGSTSRKKIDIKRERKATKVLGVVMGCFILCWLPFFIEETVSGLFHLTINEKIISVLTWLGYLNSLLNPVIYTIFSPDFRQAFGKILFGKYRKRRHRLKR